MSLSAASLILLQIGLVLLLPEVQCTSDVTINTARGSTEGPEQHEIQPFPRDPRDLDVGSFYKPEPVYTIRTEYTTSYLTTEAQDSRNRYTIDYQEASRRGRSEVTIQLLPLILSDRIFTERVQVAIEYNKRIRRIRKVWGGKVRLTGNTVYFTTDMMHSFSDSIHSFGYTIDYRGRGSSKNYPVYMEVRSADDFN